MFRRRKFGIGNGADEPGHFVERTLRDLVRVDQRERQRNAGREHPHVAEYRSGKEALQEPWRGLWSCLDRSLVQEHVTEMWRRVDRRHAVEGSAERLQLPVNGPAFFTVREEALEFGFAGVIDFTVDVGLDQFEVFRVDSHQCNPRSMRVSCRSWRAVYSLDLTFFSGISRTSLISW